jgi:ATP phosphoribosyltransferase regulatory subunit
MRDLLPPDAAARRSLTGRLLTHFRDHGYELVTTPPFERAAAIERGLSSNLDPRDLLRFVDPDSGEVALLRPDITPQIARVIATQLAELPPPWRLAYAGSVVRQRRGRTRRPRELFQCGVECVGREAAAGDLEVVRLAATAVEAAGLRDFAVELHLVPVTRELLARVGPPRREAVEAALRAKDHASLRRILAEEPAEVRAPLLACADAYGGREALRGADRWLPAFAAPHLAALRGLVRQLQAEGLAERVRVDLGEIRDLDYYSGVSFGLLSEGPGEPLGSGGRYDSLFGRYDFPTSAAGFAIDLGNLEWALRRAGGDEGVASPTRVVVCGRGSTARRRAAERLRQAGIPAAVVDGRKAQAVAYASAWGYAGVVQVHGARWALHRADGATEAVDAAQDPARWAAWMAEAVR